jgi:phosphohistidine phosphatase
MKTLLIMRHAKSSNKDSDITDHERPLNKRGKLASPRMGRLLKEEGMAPDFILSSSAKRARMTAEAVGDQSGYQGEVHVSTDLYATGPGAFIRAFQYLPDEAKRVLVVGHNPGVEELVEVLTKQVKSLPTATIVQIDLPIHSWKEISEKTQGELIYIWKPRELP